MCPYLRTTPVVGAVSAAECVRPLTAFIISCVCVVLVLCMIWHYIVRGHFYKLAFMRREVFVTPTIKSCQAAGALLSTQTQALHEERQEDSLRSAQARTVYFV